MNKKEIDRLIPLAYQALIDCGIAQKDDEAGYRMAKTFRGYIAGFGAALTMGSITSAVAFFSRDSKNTKEPRGLMMKAIYLLLRGEMPTEQDNLLKYVCSNQVPEAQLKEQILNAAIALKLAMNLCAME